MISLIWTIISLIKNSETVISKQIKKANNKNNAILVSEEK